MTLHRDQKTTRKAVSNEKVTSKKVTRKKAAKTESKPKNVTKAEQKPKTQATPKAKVEPKTEAKAELKTQATHKTQDTPKAQATPNAQPMPKAKVEPTTGAEDKARKSAPPTAAKKVRKTSVIEPSPPKITPEERWEMIARIAYHKAEKRGFAPGGEQHDWDEAEKEVNKLING